jgi:hypothetical protein
MCFGCPEKTDKMTIQRFLLIGLFCAMSVACTPQPPESVNAVLDYNATFVCDGNQLVQVRFSPFRAVLESQDMSVDMVQEPTADGYRYAGGGQSLRARGAAATWTDAKGALHDCRERLGANPNGDSKAR